MKAAPIVFESVILSVLIVLAISQLFFNCDFIILPVAFAVSLIVIFNTSRLLLKGEFTVDVLAAVALVMSLITKEYSSVLYINLMLSFARLFSYYTANKTHSALEHLIKLRPTHAKRLNADGSITNEVISKIKINDQLIVDLGDRIPVDGIIINGEGAVDQSSFTGESLPIEKQVGDQVLASTILESGSLIIKAEKVGKDTSFEKIVELISNTQFEKPKIETVSSLFAKIYIGLTLIAAVILYIITKNVYLVLGILLVVCADDIAVATPLAFTAAIGIAAKYGVIVKGSSFLEILTRIEKLVVDKTGTLTQGKLKVIQCIATNRASIKAALLLASSLASRSDHPVSKEIHAYSLEQKINKTIEVSNVREIDGKGVIGTYENEKVILGKLLLLEEQGIVIKPKEYEKIEVLKKQGNSLTFLAYKGAILAVFLLSDRIKANIRDSVKELKSLAIKTVMLTGDNDVVASKIAKESGISTYRANLLPDEKLIEIKKLSKGGNHVAMVGDGVNDAPSLTLASVGIAMGAIGSDVAVNAADIVLMKDDFSRIPYLIKLSRSVISIIRENIVMWVIFNVVGIVLVCAGILSPAGAAAYNFIMDFFPIINAMRVFTFTPQKMLKYSRLS